MSRPRSERLKKTDKASQWVAITYTNHKGMTSTRCILPITGRGLYFGTTSWHPEPQWLLNAFDATKQAIRTFAVKDISKWKAISSTINMDPLPIINNTDGVDLYHHDIGGEG